MEWREVEGQMLWMNQIMNSVLYNHDSIRSVTRENDILGLTPLTSLCLETDKDNKCTN